ncbi:MAG: hypothetical protein LC797_11060 [Chloroflexi bacterium]|nr:hypothetical protein [Chloroflexota bacterium]
MPDGQLRNCPTAENIIGVAEATVMLIVASLLKLKQKERSLREGHFRPQHAAHILRGRTVGLVGYGRIAHSLEQRLQGWGVNVQAADPYVAGTLGLDDLLPTRAREADPGEWWAPMELVFDLEWPQHQSR